jgi:hypothetical protein
MSNLTLQFLIRMLHLLERWLSGKSKDRLTSIEFKNSNVPRNKKRKDSFQVNKEPQIAK